MPPIIPVGKLVKVPGRLVAMLKLEQLAALVVAAGLAIVSYLLFFSWAGGGGYERRERAEPQALLTPEAPELTDRLSL